MKEISRKLLSTVELRARATHSSIAALLDTSEQLVHYHLRQLEQNRDILGYNAIIDHARIGCSFHLLYLSFFEVTGAQEQRWLRHVADEIPGIALVARSVGRWNAVVGTISEHNRELATLITKVCSPLKGRIAELAVTTEVECTYTSLQLLVKRKSVVISTADSSKVIGIDELDRQILGLLAQNCRISATEIAKQLRSSTATIIRRIEALEEAGVIIGYRVHIDYERFGFQQYRLLLRLSDHSTDAVHRIKQHLIQSGVVESVSRYLGMADIDFRCYFPSFEKLGEFVSQLLDCFSSVVTKVDIVPVFYWRRMNYFPVQSTR